jgi:hypothetical protein
MQFRHLHASDLEGPIDLPGVRDWIGGITPQHAALLLMAPAGTGKTAAVGAIAQRLGREVVLCNLQELLEDSDNGHQLANLLIACETHPKHVIFLDKLDGFLHLWARRHPDAPGRAGELLADWLKRHKDNLLASGITVMLVGRDDSVVPDALASACDATLVTG